MYRPNSSVYNGYIAKLCVNLPDLRREMGSSSDLGSDSDNSEAAERAEEPMVNIVQPFPVQVKGQKQSYGSFQSESCQTA